MNQAPDISLPRFEGPLDLLLALIRTGAFAITDIPIAQITRQYLDYLQQADELDMELGAEFAYMAAMLIHIKSRCLLSRDPEIAAREEDPRQELVRQLLDHEQVRQGAEFLKQKLEVNEATWSKSSMADFIPVQPEELPEANGTLNLLQILRLAKQALNAARAYAIVTPADSVTVEEMIRWLEERMAGAPDETEAGVFLAEQTTAQSRAALFLAMLEMAKTARIQLDQRWCFGPILIAGFGKTAACGTSVPLR